MNCKCLNMGSYALVTRVIVLRFSVTGYFPCWLLWFLKVHISIKALRHICLRSLEPARFGWKCWGQPGSGAERGLSTKTSTARHRSVSAHLLRKCSVLVVITCSSGKLWNHLILELSPAHRSLVYSDFLQICKCLGFQFVFMIMHIRSIRSSWTIIERTRERFLKFFTIVMVWGMWFLKSLVNQRLFKKAL